MRTTKRRNSTGRCFVGRHRPTFDRLESRAVLSGSSIDSGFFGDPGSFSSFGDTTPLSIVTTTPANLASLTSSPTSLLVDFDKPLSGFSIGLTDFKLVHVNADGSTSPFRLSEAQLLESLDLTDPSGQQIDLGLTRPLPPGHYQLILEGTNQLSGIDGSLVADPGQDEVISDFTIAPPKTGIEAATKLGIIGGTVVSQAGNLDLATNPGAVDYYQITLEPGHRWSLGLAVDSSSLGSPLTSTLSLFNDQGERISTDTTGLPTDPGDPFLFEGLDPGTYYVGVSARGNVPGLDGTYDPAGSSIQNTGASAAGGPYQLQAVAEVADQPTQILGTRLDHADPLANEPTGITLQFSAAIQINGLDQPNTPPLKLVDQNGVTWGVTPIGYNASLGQLQLVFNQALPSGRYQLELTDPSSLLDLAGAVPIAQGLAPGELASFSVGAVEPLEANDLGPIFPGRVSSSMSTTLTLSAQSSISRSFTIIEPGVYAIEGIGQTNGLAYTLVDDKGTPASSLPNSGSSEDSDVSLAIGVYTLTISNPSNQTIQTPLTILHKETVFSELMAGGISQGAALSLRLVTPQANFGMTSDLPLSSTAGSPVGSSLPVSSGAATSPGSITSTATSSAGTSSPDSSASTAVQGTSSTGSVAVTSVSPGGPPMTSLLYGFGPVGLPSSASNQISVVGTTGANGSLALASNSTSLSPGLVGIPESKSAGGNRGQRYRSEPNQGWIESPGDLEEGPEPIRVSSTDAGVLARTPQSRRADDRSLAGAEWISRLVSSSIGWFRDSKEPVEGTSDPRASTVGPVLVGEPAREPLGDESRVESATLASPIGVTAVLAAVVYRYRRALFSKKAQRAGQPSTSQDSRRSIVLGTHRSTRRNQRSISGSIPREE